MAAGLKLDHGEWTPILKKTHQYPCKGKFFKKGKNYFCRKLHRNIKACRAVKGKIIKGKCYRYRMITCPGISTNYKLFHLLSKKKQKVTLEKNGYYVYCHMRHAECVSPVQCPFLSRPKFNKGPDHCAKGTVKKPRQCVKKNQDYYVDIYNEIKRKYIKKGGKVDKCCSMFSLFARPGLEDIDGKKFK